MSLAIKNGLAVVMIFCSWIQNALSLITLPCVIFFLNGAILQAATPTPGTLIADLPVPLVVEGKTVGSMTLKAGTQISVITILPNDGGVVISRGGGAPFIVPKTALTQESLLLAIAATATPTPTPPPLVTSTPKPVEVVKPTPSTAPATPQVGAAAETDFITETNNGIITITGYTGVGGNVVIPHTINGLPLGVIGAKSFMSKKNLTSIVIPDSVTTIEGHSFSECFNLTKVALPKNLENLRTFRDTPKLSLITLDSGNSNFSVDTEGVLFDAKRSQLILYPPGKKDKTYTIPNSVTSIGPSAFQRSLNLLNVTLPESLIDIRDEGFEWCSGLKEIVIPNSVTTIKRAAFRGCDNLTTVTIGKGVTDMGDTVFLGCQKLQKVLFEGDAPGIDKSKTFENAGKSFKVYYHAKAKGFTSPVWVDSGGGKWNSSIINE